jgi:hypothetical protein
MKTLKDYIIEGKDRSRITRILITLNKDADTNTEYVIKTTSYDEKYMKGNKNNVFEIKYKLTNKTKTNYETVTGIEVTSVRLCDDAPNDNPKHMSKDQIKDFDMITIEENTSCYVIRVGNSDYTVSMSVDELYKNSLGDAFSIKI